MVGENCIRTRFGNLYSSFPNIRTKQLSVSMTTVLTNICRTFRKNRATKIILNFDPSRLHSESKPASLSLCKTLKNVILVGSPQAPQRVEKTQVASAIGALVVAHPVIFGDVTANPGANLFSVPESVFSIIALHPEPRFCFANRPRKKKARGPAKIGVRARVRRARKQTVDVKN